MVVARWEPVTAGPDANALGALFAGLPADHDCRAI